MRRFSFHAACQRIVEIYDTAVLTIASFVFFAGGHKDMYVHVMVQNAVER